MAVWVKKVSISISHIDSSATSFAVGLLALASAPISRSAFLAMDSSLDILPTSIHINLLTLTLKNKHGSRLRCVTDLLGDAGVRAVVHGGLFNSSSSVTYKTEHSEVCTSSHSHLAVQALTLSLPSDYGSAFMDSTVTCKRIKQASARATWHTFESIHVLLRNTAHSSFCKCVHSKSTPSQ